MKRQADADIKLSPNSLTALNKPSLIRSSADNSPLYSYQSAARQRRFNPYTRQNTSKKTLIGGAVCRRVRIGGADSRRNVRPCRTVCDREQFSFRMCHCLESGHSGYVNNTLPNR